MAYNFRLKLVGHVDQLAKYEAVIDGTKQWSIVLDVADDSIYPTSIDGESTSDIRMNMSTGDVTGTLSEDRVVADFTTMAAHLAYQFKKTGTPPSEIQKHFA